jgi:hypothetical protein
MNLGCSTVLTFAKKTFLKYQGYFSDVPVFCGK